MSLLGNAFGKVTSAVKSALPHKGGAKKKPAKKPAAKKPAAKKTGAKKAKKSKK